MARAARVCLSSRCRQPFASSGGPLCVCARLVATDLPSHPFPAIHPTVSAAFLSTFPEPPTDDQVAAATDSLRSSGLPAADCCSQVAAFVAPRCPCTACVTGGRSVGRALLWLLVVSPAAAGCHSRRPLPAPAPLPRAQPMQGLRQRTAGQGSPCSPGSRQHQGGGRGVRPAGSCLHRLPVRLPGAVKAGAAAGTAPVVHAPTAPTPQGHCCGMQSPSHLFRPPEGAAAQRCDAPCWPHVMPAVAAP